MKRGFWLKAFLILFFVTLSGCVCAAVALFGYPQPVQDWVDRRALEKQFNGLAKGLELVSFAGYPSRAGFGQQEGLEISAAYRVMDAQMDAFKARALAEGWAPLPIPASTRSKILIRGMDVPLDAQDGLFVCNTSGDNVLYAEKTRPCASAGVLHDIIIGVLDAPANALYLVIRSGY